MGGRPVVDATQAREHMERMVKAHGLNYSHFGRLAGLSCSVIHRVRDAKYVACETADLVLAVRDEHVGMRPPSRVPAESSRKHIAMLRSTGASLEVIAGVVGMPQQTLAKISRPATRTVERATRAAILAVTADEVAANRVWVSRGPSVTRLRALQANGWTHVALLAYGVSMHNVTRHRGDSPLLASTAEHIEKVYRTIGDQVGPSEGAARWAKSLGFYPPIYYDEDMKFIRVDSDTAEERAQYDARETLCVLALTAADYGLADIEKMLGMWDGKGSKLRAKVGFRVRTGTNSIRLITEPYDGAMAVVREVTRDIHVSSSLDVLDAPGLDYVALLARVVNPGEAALLASMDAA